MAFTGVVPALFAVKDAIVLLPVAPSPIDVVELVQLYAVPVPVNAIAPLAEPLQRVKSAVGVMLGVGFTV